MSALVAIPILLTILGSLLIFAAVFTFHKHSAKRAAEAQTTALPPLQRVVVDRGRVIPQLPNDESMPGQVRRNYPPWFQPFAGSVEKLAASIRSQRFAKHEASDQAARAQSVATKSKRLRPDPEQDAEQAVDRNKRPSSSHDRSDQAKQRQPLPPTPVQLPHEVEHSQSENEDTGAQSPVNSSRSSVLQSRYFVRPGAQQQAEERDVDLERSGPGDALHLPVETAIPQGAGSANKISSST